MGTVSLIKALSTEILINELIRRNDHAEIHLCKELTESKCIYYDQFKGEYDPDEEYEYVVCDEPEDEDDEEE